MSKSKRKYNKKIWNQTTYRPLLHNISRTSYSSKYSGKTTEEKMKRFFDRQKEYIRLCKIYDRL